MHVRHYFRILSYEIIPRKKTFKSYHFYGLLCLLREVKYCDSLGPRHEHPGSPLRNVTNCASLTGYGIPFPLPTGAMATGVCNRGRSSCNRLNIRIILIFRICFHLKLNRYIFIEHICIIIVLFTLSDFVHVPRKLPCL